MGLYGLRDLRLYLYSGHDGFDTKRVWDQIDAIAHEHNSYAYRPDTGDGFSGPIDDGTIAISSTHLQRMGEMIEKLWSMKEMCKIEIEHQGR